MQIAKIQLNNIQNLNYQNNIQNNTKAEAPISQPLKYAEIPLNYQFGALVNFKGGSEFFDPNRTMPHIDYEEYKAMNENTKIRFRKRYLNFDKDPYIDKQELVDSKFLYMPLRTEKSMNEFLKTASIYNRYKDQPIICLGRSPKWFLNASLWMNGGINDYKFVAFSKYWYRPDYREGVKRYEDKGPTEKEVIAYRKYLQRIQADPYTIVKHHLETGKKTVITDYICSGKGCTSFLEVMGDYADDLGILEEFSKAIQIVGIGSMEYMEDLHPDADEIEIPKVHMPPILKPYERNIKQEYYDMDYIMFREMLLNQNTNECRSTYYPHEAWTVYKPDQFKTGLIKDMKKVKEVRAQLKGFDQISHFTPAMYDYRNLLNFWILDNLNQRGMLKPNHKSKM
ncbi:hypothetical protein J6A64_02400 [bacterium]|nr:hypothetical protein [bacterium]